MRPFRWNNGQAVTIEEVPEGSSQHRSSNSQPIIEEPGDTRSSNQYQPGGHNPHFNHGANQLMCQPDFFAHSSMFGELGDFSFPGFFGMRSSLDLDPAFSAPVMPAPGSGHFSYACSSWSSVSNGQGGGGMEHRVSARGNSRDGHQLKEAIRDTSTGQTRILREESRPVGYRHGSHAQQAIANE